MAYRILIVDDEAALQNMVKEILTQAGYETASALTCAQALEQFQILPPDAVLLDVNLPDGDGLPLLGILPEHPIGDKRRNRLINTDFRPLSTCWLW